MILKTDEDRLAEARTDSQKRALAWSSIRDAAAKIVNAARAIMATVTAVRAAYLAMTALIAGAGIGGVVWALLAGEAPATQPAQ